jgi:hypothetical protein
MVTFADLGVVRGAYQTAGSLPPQGVQRTVKGYEAVMMNDNGQQVLKPVLHFAEASAASLVLNKTNRTILERAWGPELDAWIGRPMMLLRTQTMLRGQPTPGIMVQPMQPMQPVAPVQQPIAPMQRVQHPAAPATPAQAGSTDWDSL